MKVCGGFGFLVGTGQVLPEDPWASYTGRPPLVGCNRVVCTACGSPVRHVDGACVPTPNPTPAEAEALYRADDPRALRLLLQARQYDVFRAYLCRCSWAHTGSSIQLEYGDVPWQCGGHPE